MFIDRMDAGLRLAWKLKKYKNDDGIVLAIPRGGVPVAYAVAKALDFPLEVILTKKIGHPTNKEYAIGAASMNDYFIVPHKNVSESYIENELRIVRRRLREMYINFTGKTHVEKLEGKTVLIIDDGIATGNTLIATVNLLRKSKLRKIVIGVPVASINAVEKLSKVVDDLVAVLIPETFHGVGAFYKNFEQVSDGEVLRYLNQWNLVGKVTEIISIK